MSGLHAEIALDRGDFDLDATIAVEPGEVLAVLGPNGAGKSTLLGALAGELRPQRGAVRLGGADWLDTARGTELPTHRRGVGLLAQRALLFPHLSVLDNVAFGPRAAGLGKARSRAAAERWLAEVEAAELARRAPGELSGGQAQRVALARALAAGPRLLLLDEPLAALDVDAAPAVRGLLHRVLRAQETPTVLVTHDVLDAIVLADRLVVLQDGRIVEGGPTRQVLSRPQEPFTARAAGLNLITGAHTGAGVHAGEVLVTGREVEPVGERERAAAVFAPSAVAVHPEPPRGSPRNAIPVRLTGLEPRGDVVRVRGAAGEAALAADVTPAAVADLGIGPGDEVWFVIKAAEVAIHPVSGGSSGA